MNTAEARKLITRELKKNTSIGERVYSPRTWPVHLTAFPVILVSAETEHKTSEGRHTPQFTTITTIRIDGRVLAYDSEKGAGDGAGIAWEEAESLKEEIERAIIGNPAIRMKFQQIRDIRAQIAVDSDSEGNIGQVLLEMDLEYYQGPEDFYRSEFTPLQVVDVRGTLPPFRLYISLPAGNGQGSETDTE
ncbi:phage tail protein [Escherichia coli]|uniref:phage tail protein n=1 Tax=Escherichia coli TaxID=562 RepID=UPI001F115793|nr:phage tail protein [Escherichia coli]UMR99568.1 phage tail protein [Escherichia coli]